MIGKSDDDPDEYCDNGGSDLSSDIAGTTNHGSGVGWCMSTLDEKVGCTASPAECWATCEGAHGDRLVAIDWYADGSCWCQDSCPCMDFDLSPVVITRDDITLPNECTLCDYYEHALYGDCAGSDASDACQSDYYQAIECHYEAQLAELGETCPTQTCVEVLATPAPTPRPSTAAPVPAPTIPVTLAPTVKGSLDPSSPWPHRRQRLRGRDPPSTTNDDRPHRRRQQAPASPAGPAAAAKARARSTPQSDQYATHGAARPAAGDRRGRSAATA